MLPGYSRDAAEMSDANSDNDLYNQYTVDLADEIDTLEDQLLEKFSEFEPAKELIEAFCDWHRKQVEIEAEKAKGLAIGRIVGGIIGVKNAKLAIMQIAFASGLDQLNGIKSERHAAKMICCSVAAISKGVQIWRRALELPTITKFLKSDDARASYKRSKLENHPRHRNGSYL